jgi:hypothetical protein
VREDCFNAKQFVLAFVVQIMSASTACSKLNILPASGQLSFTDMTLVVCNPSSPNSGNALFVFCPFVSKGHMDALRYVKFLLRECNILIIFFFNIK